MVRPGEPRLARGRDRLQELVPPLLAALGRPRLGPEVRGVSEAPLWAELWRGVQAGCWRPCVRLSAELAADGVCPPRGVEASPVPVAVRVRKAEGWQQVAERPADRRHEE